MEALGEVVRTAQGLAVVRCPDDDPPNVGTQAIDEQLNEVGRVVDVFGPVSRPYAAVSPDDGVTLAPLLGKKLYAR
ncbi:H/ACA ribonucleoprotein complex subunit GAR1 [Halorussus sp. MSC15.2]|uniref:H/ACA ribonucleoprotein complex subunit GAR1 n=1 Tax=Halorussus sp. MSC15.2 TaxID=2283638 RepID=UPI0013D69169|nr:Gar1/Naf1 family protein [Halorussus sp. MSC15.2]NEU59244.1 H/ACA RNA-protein complex component Gar1 [Halorussus sp. MSC15.2]